MKNKILNIILIVTVALGFCVISQTNAYAEGPGYGGNADTLHAEWKTSTQTSSLLALSTPPPIPDDKIKMGEDNLTLVVSGVGFRGNSPVNIEVGTTIVNTRTDSSGILTKEIPISKITTNNQIITGQSVIAQGISSNGGEKTLLGSVPPPPSGTNPFLPVIGLISLFLLPFAVKKMLKQPKLNATVRNII